MFARFLPVARSLQVIQHVRCDFRYTQAASFAKMYGSNNKSKHGAKKGEDKFSAAAAAESILINEKIRYPSMRVVFTNAVTGETEWKIMSRGDALFEASNRKLDLVLGMLVYIVILIVLAKHLSTCNMRPELVNDKSDPPVCKIESFKGKIQQLKAFDKEIKQKEKDRRQKEMYMTGGIEARDFKIKMNKVDSFLKKGHTVKVTIVPKRFTKNNRFKDGVRRDRMGGQCLYFSLCVQYELQYAWPYYVLYLMHYFHIILTFKRLVYILSPLPHLHYRF